jgi:hypothetical protein
MWITIEIVYVVGLLVGLLATDSGLVARIGLALAWPLGPLTFLATVAGLLVVAAIAFPFFGVALAAAIAAAWWAIR